MARDPRDPAHEYRDKHGNFYRMMSLGAWADEPRRAEYQRDDGMRIVTTVEEIEERVTAGEWTDATPPMPPCLNAGDDCAGEVEYRMTGYGWKAWPRCAYHGDKALRDTEALLQRYNGLSDMPPDWFDEANAGEHWHEDDYS